MRIVGSFILLLPAMTGIAGANLELLSNGGFEEDTDINGRFKPDGWGKWAWNGWSGWKNHDPLSDGYDGSANYPAYEGTAYAYCGGSNGRTAGITQVIMPTAGQRYKVSLYARTEDWGDGAPYPDHNLRINIKWWGDFGDGVTSILETLPLIVNGPENFVYSRYSATTGICPVGTTSGQFELISGGAGSVLYDNASMTAIGAASDPDPLNNSSLKPSPGSGLGWVLPSPNHDTDIILCDVWIREYTEPNTIDNLDLRNDPDFLTGAVKLVNKQSATSVNFAAAGYTPEEGRVYLWKIDCYDPNGGTELFTPGAVWAFNTFNAAPEVNAGVKQAKWLPDGIGPAVFDLDATVNDDGLPLGSSLAVQWQPTAGVSFDDDTLENAQATISAPGDYLLTLVADDGMETSSDTVLLKVYDYITTGLLGQWPLDSNADNILGDPVKNGNDIGTPTYISDSQAGSGALETWLENYVEIPNSGSDLQDDPATWADLTDEVTLSAWIKIDGFETQWQNIISKGSGTYRFQRAHLTNSVIFTYGEGDSQFTAWGRQNVADNRWHHIAGTIDGVYIRLYIDGVMDDEVPADTAVNPIPVQDANIKFGNGGRVKIDNVRLRNIGIPHKSDHPGTPSVLAEFTSDGGRNACGQVYSDADINKDCYVNLADFALMAAEWLECTDITNIAASGGICIE